MTPRRRKTLLVAGASGVIGTGAVEYFAQLPGWQVVGMSRRRPLVADDCNFTHVSVDLSDGARCGEAITALTPVTHLIYAAVAEATGLIGGWQDASLMALNGMMFENLLYPLAASGHLRHVSLLQGAKAYGAHIHPVSVPLREDAPRDRHPNFYWLHEDALRTTAAKSGFAFNIWRPQVLLGTAPGAAMNPVVPIAAYAAICHERDLPFALPGSGLGLLELVDTALLAEAMAWAITSRAAHGQTFNITNGDSFVLRHSWDALAAAIWLATDGKAPTDFATFFAEEANQQAWAAIAARHDLIERSLSALLGQSQHYLDLLGSRRLTERTPVLLSTIKLRQAGFADCRDSLSALIGQIRRMTELRVMPPLVP